MGCSLDRQTLLTSLKPPAAAEDSVPLVPAASSNEANGPTIGNLADPQPSSQTRHTAAIVGAAKLACLVLMQVHCTCAHFAITTPSSTLLSY